MSDRELLELVRVAREEIKRQAAEIEYLKARLEVSAYHPYDGIASRDATIKLQDEHIAELQAKYDCNTAIMHARTDAMNKHAARAAELEQDAARYRFIRTHRIGIKWCEMYAGGPLLDGVIDSFISAANPKPIKRAVLRATAEGDSRG